MATKHRQRTREPPLSLGELFERLAPFWAPPPQPGERPASEVFGRPPDMVILEACRVARRDGPQALEAWLQDLAARLPTDLGAEERATYTAFFEQLATPAGRARLVEARLHEWIALACKGAKASCLPELKVSYSPELKELAAFVEYFHTGQEVPLDLAAGMLALVLLWFRLGEFAAVIQTRDKLATAFVQADGAREGGVKRRRARLDGEALTTERRIALWREALAPQLGSDGKPRRGAVSRAAKELANAFGTSCGRERRFFYENADAILKP